MWIVPLHAALFQVPGALELCPGQEVVQDAGHMARLTIVFFQRSRKRLCLRFVQRDIAVKLPRFHQAQALCFI